MQQGFLCQSSTSSSSSYQMTQSENIPILADQAADLYRRYRLVGKALEKRQAGVSGSRVILIGDTPVIAENLPFFGLNQS
jgi:hypothetical protein